MLSLNDVISYVYLDDHRLLFAFINNNICQQGIQSFLLIILLEMQQV